MVKMCSNIPLKAYLKDSKYLRFKRQDIKNSALAHLNAESKFLQLQKKSTSNYFLFTSKKVSKNIGCIFHSLEDTYLFNLSIRF